tara:strand:+ start:7108 stop:7602 length:495 start_codon:yes stop_codon:yes gene_type:complete
MNKTREKLKKIHDLCIQHNISISTAESCTGGYISKYITDYTDSSKYYKGSIIAYSNEVKSSLLEVPDNIIEKYGAVSREVSILMSKGLLKSIRADIALSTTGVMEKVDGSSCKHPQVFITIKSLHDEHTAYYKLKGNRDENRENTVYFTFNCLYDFIHKNYLLS